MARLYLADIKAIDLVSSGITFIETNDDQIAPDVSGIPLELQRVVKNWEGVAVIIHHHLATDSWIFIALHDLTLGPAAGGTRIKHYATPIDGLLDTFHLSEAMTSKWAIIDSAWGGGKAVLGLPCELNRAERQKLLRDYAGILNGINGAFSTAGDLGTTPEDLNYLASLTPHVTSDDQSHGESVDSGTYTALGLRAAIRGCLAVTFGDAEIKGRSVLVQGLGQVGGMLARLMMLDGARVLINDFDEARMAQFQKELDCTVVDSNIVYETLCDVYAPCGVGGTLNEETISRLRCRVVCGGANNQLASRDIADKLQDRGILYAPDYIVNSGGAIGLTMFGRGEPEVEIYARIEAIETKLARIFHQASAQSVSPARAADENVKTILAEARVRNTAYQFNLPTPAFAQSR